MMDILCSIRIFNEIISDGCTMYSEQSIYLSKYSFVAMIFLRFLRMCFAAFPCIFRQVEGQINSCLKNLWSGINVGLFRLKFMLSVLRNKAQGGVSN